MEMTLENFAVNSVHIWCCFNVQILGQNDWTNELLRWVAKHVTT